MDVPGKGGDDGGGWDEEITNGRKDKDEALTPARKAEFLHNALAFS